MLNQKNITFENITLIRGNIKVVVSLLFIPYIVELFKFLFAVFFWRIVGHYIFVGNFLNDMMNINRCTFRNITINDILLLYMFTVL